MRFLAARSSSRLAASPLPATTSLCNSSIWPLST